MSNKKKSENLFGLMGKVSCAMIINTGLVDPKKHPNWVYSIGQKVNILLLNKVKLSVVSETREESSFFRENKTKENRDDEIWFKISLS